MLMRDVGLGHHVGTETSSAPGWAEPHGLWSKQTRGWGRARVRAPEGRVQTADVRLEQTVLFGRADSSRCFWGPRWRRGRRDPSRCAAPGGRARVGGRSGRACAPAENFNLGVEGERVNVWGPPPAPGHSCLHPFQVWLFRQRPESLDPLSKYLSTATGFGSTYVTAQKVSAHPGRPPAPAGARRPAAESGPCVWAAVAARPRRSHAGPWRVRVSSATRLVLSPGSWAPCPAGRLVALS